MNIFCRSECAPAAHAQAAWSVSICFQKYNEPGKKRKKGTTAKFSPTHRAVYRSTAIATTRVTGTYACDSFAITVHRVASAVNPAIPLPCVRFVIVLFILFYFFL
jgi:hypothetical protein